MFTTRTIWNHFIVVFTVANSVSEKKRDAFANNFIASILNVLEQFYLKNKVDDNLPIPKMLQYYFVELGNDDDYKLDPDTMNNLTDINKYTFFLPPISNTKEKIIVDIIHNRNKRVSLEIYDRIVEDKHGTLKRVAANIGTGVALLGLGALGSAAIVGTAGSATGIVAPALINTGVLAGTSYLSYKAGVKVNQVDYEHTVDKSKQNEDYLTFDEDIYVYHDGTTEIKRTNVKEFTRIIEKKSYT